MVKEKKRLKSAAHVSSISLYQEPVDEENTVIQDVKNKDLETLRDEKKSIQATDRMLF